MFKRVYVEIGNVCNMNCSFCAGTKRPRKQMTLSEFRTVCQRLCGFTENLLFHVMGEPLLHPELDAFFKVAAEYGYKVSITTNGTLLSKKSGILKENKDTIHRVSISMHAPEGNGMSELSIEDYVNEAVSFAREFSALDKNVVFRLWNLDSEDKKGKNDNNETILKILKKIYSGEWEKRYSGYRLAYRTFLEFDGIFTWPSESKAEETECGRCHALTQQIAILADGTVVPCCLDSEGIIPLGNIFDLELDKILNSNISLEMKTGFLSGKMVHPLCKKCVYARRFSKK